MPLGPSPLLEQASQPKYRRLFIAALALGCLSDSAFAQLREQPREPSVEEVRSGTCKVKVCTDFDFGDYRFRIYTAYKPLTWSSTLTEIPRGACECGSVVGPGRDFNRHLLFARRTPDGQVRANISVLQGSTEMTFEEFKRRQPDLEFLPNFTWKDYRFEQFRVFQSKQAFALGARNYFFVPTEDAELEFDGRRQPMAFSIGLPWRPDDEKRELRVAATVRLSGSVFFSISESPYHAFTYLGC